MVYEKYIKKNGKVYGPYVYHSRRVNGKVISEYQGRGKLNYKRIALLIFGFVFLALLIFFFYNFNEGITGNVVLNPMLNSQTENAAEKLSISLKQGELIPASSEVIFTTPENEYEYLLSELISSNSVEGNYYIEGRSVSGSGKGYGIKGTQIIYPKVYFTLISNQFSVDDSNENNQVEDESSSDKEKVNEEKELPKEEIQDEVDEETSSEEDNLNEESNIQNETEEIGGNETEEKNESVSDTEVIDETSDTEVIDETSDTEVIDETITEESQEAEKQEQELEQLLQDNEAEQSSDEINSDKDSDETEKDTGAPITGDVISMMLEGVSNFFLSFLKFTGSATSELNIIEINAEASLGNPFIYELNEGEEIELIKGSVRTDSGNLTDRDIQFSVQDNTLVIETDYFELNEGFGKDYIGNEEKILYMNLPENLSGDDFEIKILYNDEDLLSLTDEVSNDETIIEEVDLNLSIERLSNEETKFLEDELGNISVKMIKSELFNGRYVIGYEFGDYEIEYSYASELSKEVLKQQMEVDKVKWLRDIIAELLKEENVHEEVDLSSS